MDSKSTTPDPVLQRELERARNEVAELKQANRNLQRTLDHSHRIARLMFWECNGPQLTWHASFEALVEFFGRVPNSNKELLSIIHEEDRDRVQDIYDCERTTDRDFRAEYRIVLPDGTVRYVQEIGVPTYNDIGRLNGHHGTMQDISERKLYESVRERLIEELTDRNRELDQFAYTVSHDLKAPLITIRGFAGLLQRDMESGVFEKTIDDVGQISNAAEKMGRLLDDLLQLSRVGHFINPDTETPLNELVDELKRTIDGVLVGIEIRVDSDLPVVFGDRTRLVELLQNLLDNAAKFTRGCPAPCISVSAVDRGDEIECSVADNGIGIEADFHDKVFGLFETLGVEGSGTGLGLTLARRIVEYHGGRIWVESKGAGQGSRFCFTLPKRGVRIA